MSEARLRSSATSRSDWVAGVSVALVLLPQSMAYAELAGLPPWHGLYAAAVAPLVAAPFASSRYLQTGPAALTALLTFGALAPLHVAGSASYVSAAALLALMVGVIRVVIGVARWGVVARLMTPAVRRGFTLGAAVLIAASQLPAALGVEPASGGIFSRCWAVLTLPARWNPLALGLSVGTVALMRLGPKLNPLFPGVLVAVAAGLVVPFLGLDAGPQIGAVPQVLLPPLQLTLPWAEVPRLLVPAVIIALVGFAEAAAISRAFADRDAESWNASREFVSQGMANLGAGLFSGFPVGGSFSRSSIARVAGGRTPRTGAITGLLVLCLLPISAFLSPLPRSVLGAIVVGAVLSLIDPRPLLRLWSDARGEFLVGALTLLATLLSAPHVEWGVLVGILAAGVLRLVNGSGGAGAVPVPEAPPGS